MVVTLAVHASNDTKLVGMFGKFRVCFRDFDARLPKLGKLVWAFHGNVLRLATHKNIILLENRNRLTIIFRQGRLWIKKINMTGTTVHEQKNN